jgi:YggT family protein
MGGIIDGIAAVLGMALDFYRWIVIIAVLLQLVNADPGNALVGFFRAATEPAFVAIRRRLPFVIVGGFDLSPLVVLAIIIFLQHAVVGNLYRLAA